MSTRFEKYWTDSGRGDGQGDVEKNDHQLYRRPYMMGKEVSIGPTGWLSNADGLWGHSSVT